MKKRTSIENLWTTQALKKGDLVNVMTVSGSKYIGKIINIVSQHVNLVENWFNVVEEVDESEYKKNGE